MRDQRDQDFYSEESVFLRDVSRLLTDCGCCAYCTLRFMGLKSMYKYRDDTKAMEAWVERLHNLKPEGDPSPVQPSGISDTDSTISNTLLSEQADNKEMTTEQSNSENGKENTKTPSEDAQTPLEDRHTPAGVCIVCLGILQEYMSKDFLERIRSVACDNGYVFSSFTSALMTPVCVILRENALLLHLKEKFSSVYENVKFSSVCHIKDVWKWRNGMLLKEVLKAPFDSQSPFNININWEYEDSDKECSFLLSMMSDTFRQRKKDKRFNKKSAFSLFNRANVAKAITDITDAEFKRNFQCPPVPPINKVTCDLSCQQEAVYVAGRYNKYSRTLSQTPWMIEGQRRSESSVQELLCTEVNKHFKSTEQKFSSSGREDVDVLMLGNGRPFVLELINPKQRCFSSEEMMAIQKSINAATKDIQCRDLQIVKRGDVERLKDGEIFKVKDYTALCWSQGVVTDDKLKSLNETKELTILQKTPIRVLHRRPLATRDRIVHWMKTERVDDHHFRLELSTQAGTYIKEFVHGDFGRTKPSLTTLLGEDCDILDLDVMGVELDWPPKIAEDPVETKTDP